MKKILGILAGAALVSATPAHATNGMRMIGFGPTQNAMGGAGVAAPLDSAAIVSNPAGLSGLAPRLDLAAQAFMPTVEYTMKTPGPTFTGSSDRPADVLPTLGAIYRLQDGVTFGFAALGTAGMGVDYKADSGTGGTRLMSSYMNGRVAPAASYQLNDRLAVGVALNLMYAQMAFEMQGSPKFSASSLGYGATIGVTYKAHDMVTLGAAYETKSFFQDFEDTLGGVKQAIDLDQPMIATLGVAVRPAQGLLLALDGEWINWSDVMGKDKPKFTAPPGGGSFDMRWSDQIVVKVGAEYAIDALKLRAGYNYGAMPLEKQNWGPNMMFPAVAEHHVTVGAGYGFGKLDVNFAAVYSPASTLKSGPDTTGTAGFSDLEAKMSQLAFEFGGTYRF